MDYSRLYRKLAYQFNDQTLLIKALTHRSVSNNNNERFEYLGDSIINFFVAEALFHQFPELSEGELSRMRSNLVKKESLAHIAQQLELGDFLHLGSGELKSGGFRRESILADALEAIIAAIYLDANLETCRQKILPCFETMLKTTAETMSHKDPKTELQEYLQSKHIELPEYHIIKTEGKDHKQIFYVSCRIISLNLEAVGTGSNRRRAEQAAAEEILRGLNHE